MFVHLLWLLLVAFVLHVTLTKPRSRERIGELGLLYLLVGYCGVPMLLVGIASAVHGHELAELLGFPPDNPFQAFLTAAYLGMAVIATSSLRYRGAYLVGPAVCWAIFFAGATIVHLRDFEARGAMDHGSALTVFAAHGLISLLLLVALGASGVWRKSAGG